ncbi:MAG: S53 family peptidase [Dehalococcoidia bacterium]
MPLPQDRVPLPGSERQPIPGAWVIGAPDPNESLTVTVYVRKDPAAGSLPPVEDLGAQLPQQRQYLSDTDLAGAYGANAEDLAKVEAFARAHGLEVIESSIAKRSVQLRGTVADLSSAFGVDLKHYQSAEDSYRGRTGPIHVPPELDGIVEAVFGLDNRRVGQSWLRRARPIHAELALRATSYLPPQVAQLYNFPPGLDGTGQCIAILAFNGELPTGSGGYRMSALQAYFEQVLRQKTPQVSDVVVHGPGNDPGDATDPRDATGEIMLDIQVTGAVDPAAKLMIYFTVFTEQGWVDALNTVITDTANKPSVVSISYGNPEDDPRSAWTAAAIQKVNEVFQLAAARGLTIICASGDDGSRDQAGDGRAHADFPASSPFVLGCGGTRLESMNGAIVREAVWNDGPGSAGGGGISAIFPLPAWQQGVHVVPSANPLHRVGRGVPDVSGVADPQTGVKIMNIDGQHLEAVGGTSATAPLWAALIARINQSLRTSAGYLNPLLYTRFATGVLRDITQGNNGAYRAGPGWDACTGLGSPDGVALLRALSGAPAPVVPAPHGNTGVTTSEPILSSRTDSDAIIARLEAELAAERAERRLLLEITASLTRLLGRLSSADET